MRNGFNQDVSHIVRIAQRALAMLSAAARPCSLSIKWRLTGPNEGGPMPDNDDVLRRQNAALTRDLLQWMQAPRAPMPTRSIPGAAPARVTRSGRMLRWPA